MINVQLLIYQQLNTVRNSSFHKHGSRILSTGGGGVYLSMHWGRHPPPKAGIPACTGADTPPGRYPNMHWGRHPPLGWYSSMHWGRHPHLGWYPSMHWGRHPPGQVSQHALGQTPPDGHCSGRYASYWNAFLFIDIRIKMKGFLSMLLFQRPGVLIKQNYF